MSAGMCSSTSEATTRSNSPSAKGSDKASPSLMSADAPSGTSPASFMAPNSSSTPASSSASWSNAMTSAPRRYISNAWRPAPQPMSITRSPGRRPRRSKSIVSTVVSLVFRCRTRGDDLFVRCSGRTRDGAPAELLQDALATGPAHRLAAGRVVEQLLDRGLELSDVTRGHERGADAVLTDDLRDRPRPADDQRRRARHELGGREGEAFVERRHAGDLGRTHDVDQL